MFKLCWGKSPVILQKHEWPFWGLCWIPWLFTSPFHFNWLQCENLPLFKSLVVVSLQIPGGCSQLESWSLSLRMYSLIVSLRFRGTPRRFPGLLMGGASPLVLCLQVPVASLFLNLDLWIPSSVRLQYPGGSSSLCQNQKIPPGRNLGLSQDNISLTDYSPMIPVDQYLKQMFFPFHIVFYLFMVAGLAQHQLHLRPEAKTCQYVFNSFLILYWIHF